MSLSELNSDIAAFRHYLQSERGLADNTVQAYGRDLDRFVKWCALVRYSNYIAPTLKDLGRYLAFLHDEELAPPSIARHLVALKMFYRFLRLEEAPMRPRSTCSARRSCGSAYRRSCRRMPSRSC